MTTELEQKFFKAFGIEPDCTYLFLIDGNGENKAARTMSFGSKADLKRFVCECGGKGKVIKATGSPHIYYPEITDRKLLEMICILGNGKDGSKNLNLYTANEDEWFAVLKDQYNLAYCAAIDKDFKNAILKLCIYRADIEDFKHQIQQLFKEEE